MEILISQKRVKNILIVVDTCSAGTLFSKVKDIKGNVYLVGSSGWDEYAYSRSADKLIGQPLTDEFSFYLNKFIRKIQDEP